MILKQYYLGCLAHASYLMGDEASATAIIVDPQRDIQQYLDDAEKFQLQIRHVFLTHFHADFVAGHLELRDRCGAEIRLGARAQAEYPFVAMKEGDRLDLAGLSLEVLETPGHTIESISILVFDPAKDAARPYAVLTGDTLFIGDVGRPDLRASLGWTANDLGAHLYDSLHGKLLPLPDATLVYPAHGAGSLCGKKLSSDTVSTLGDQRRLNYALQPMSKEDFIRLVTADQPDAPPYFTYDAILNTRERPTLDQNLAQALRPVELAEVLEMGDAGAQILDVRDPAEYAKGHLAGSINVGLGGQYATWAGTVLDRARPIVIIAEPGREEEAAMRLGRIGFDHVRGFLRGGMEALSSRTDLVWPTERMAAPMLAEELAGADAPWLLDVRGPNEWKAQHIEGGVNIPLNHLQERMAEIPRDRRIAVHCAGGYRSSIAASILHQHGITQLTEMAGGLAAWNAARLPMDLKILQEKKHEFAH
jgi:rhodanese-related sulfurtransferase/glyoxylase-like metal-dependent hydrolase (beta-lactamase superfamily II)